MSIVTALLVFAVTAVLCLGIPIAVLLLLKKKNYKLSAINILIGMLSFIVAFACYFIVLKFHLSGSDNVQDYYNTPFYRVMIISLLTVLVTVLLWVFCTIGYIKRQNFRSCLSFFSGFGCSATVLVGLYSVSMFFVLLFKLFSGYVGFDAELQAFEFRNEVFVSVFEPIGGHISYGIAALGFLLAEVLLGVCLNRIGQNRLPFWTSFVTFVGLVLALTVIVVSVCFATLFGWAHYFVAGVVVVMDALCLLMVWLAGKFSDKSKKEAYQKQFD